MVFLRQRPCDLLADATKDVRLIHRHTVAWTVTRSVRPPIEIYLVRCTYGLCERLISRIVKDEGKGHSIQMNSH
jgi:hypothetical protein